MKKENILEYLNDLEIYFYMDRHFGEQRNYHSNMPDIMIKKIAKIKKFIKKESK